MKIQAAQIKSGMTYHDGSMIEVLSETKSFITISLSNGFMMEGKSIERKIKKSSMIEVR
jgi:hypothetical protein